MKRTYKEPTLTQQELKKAHQIMGIVAGITGIGIQEIQSTKRERKLFLPRYILATALTQAGFSAHKAAKAMNRKQHGTILSNIKQHINLLPQDADLRLCTNTYNYLTGQELCH